MEVTPAPRATPVVNKPTLQQEIVDEVAVELGVVPREELEAHRELEAITEGAPSEPDEPQVEIHDGVDMVITMSDEEASEWITDNDDGVTQHDASGLSEDTQMLELMQADRAAEEAADPEPAEPPPRVDTELDEDFQRLVNSEAMGEYITASLTTACALVGIPAKAQRDSQKLSCNGGRRSGICSGICSGVRCTLRASRLYRQDTHETGRHEYREE